MAVTTLKPTINIKSSFTTIGAGFKKATKSVGSMRSILLKRTKVKRDAIAGKRSLFGKRIENQRRKDEEAVVEASKPTGISRIGNSVLNSGKGLLDRIMDFIGTLLIGWLANNLPTIITMAQDLMGRIQKTVNILGNFMKDIGAIFTGSTKVLGAVFTDITTLDFFDTHKRLRTALGDLEDVFSDMGKQFDDGVKTLTTPLGQMPGEKPVPPTGTDYTVPPGEKIDSGPVPKSHREAFDKVKNWASAAGSPAPEITAAIAMNESGWLTSDMATMDNNVFGQTGVGPAGYVIGADKQKHERYTSQKQAVEYHVRYWKKYYKGNTPDEIFRSLVAARYNTATPSWRSTNEGIYESMTGKSRNAPISAKGTSGPSPSGKSQPAQVSSAPSQTSIPQTTTGGKVIEYLTGDRTSPRYDAGHAAGNYHDHIAFDNQATRDAAMKFLVGKGWTIGSVESGKHARGSYHYSHQAFDIPFYPNQSRKGVPDNAKGETALSSRLRADLIAGGFSGPQLGGGGRSSIASVASVPSAAPSLPSTARAPQFMVMDDRPAPQPQQPQVASGGGSAPPMMDSENVLNNLMRNYLLLDLAYT